MASCGARNKLLTDWANMVHWLLWDLRPQLRLGAPNAACGVDLPCPYLMPVAIFHPWYYYLPPLPIATYPSTPSPSTPAYPSMAGSNSSTPSESCDCSAWGDDCTSNAGNAGSQC